MRPPSPKDCRRSKDSLENPSSLVGWAPVKWRKVKPFSTHPVYRLSNIQTPPSAVFVTCGGIARGCARCMRLLHFPPEHSTTVRAAPARSQLLALRTKPPQLRQPTPSPPTLWPPPPYQRS